MTEEEREKRWSAVMTYIANRVKEKLQKEKELKYGGGAIDNRRTNR